VETFIANNPEVVLTLAGMAGTSFVLLLGVLGWQYRLTKKQEESLFNRTIVTLTQALDEVKTGLLSATREVQQWMAHTDNRLTKLETEHHVLTGSGVHKYKEE